MQHEVRKKHVLLMHGNMLNVSSPAWLNVIFFPLFRHLPITTARVLAKGAPSCKLSLQSPFPRLATTRTDELFSL
jgi:hypothetical protein